MQEFPPTISWCKSAANTCVTHTDGHLVAIMNSDSGIRVILTVASKVGSPSIADGIR